MLNSNSMYSGKDGCELCVGDKIFTLFGTGEFPAKRWWLFCQQSLRKIKTNWRVHWKAMKIVRERESITSKKGL